MEEWSITFTFGFTYFTLFRGKHDHIKDFCKVSVSFALNAAFLDHMLQLHIVRSMKLWDESVKT